MNATKLSDEILRAWVNCIRAKRYRQEAVDARAKTVEVRAASQQLRARRELSLNTLPPAAGLMSTANYQQAASGW